MIAVALIYEKAPLSFISLKKTGITKPADLAGRKGAAPAVDATFRLFDVFARIDKVDPKSVQRTNVQPQVREAMLVRGDVDFTAAWVMTAVPSAMGLGVKREDLNVMMLLDHGLDLYANVVFTTAVYAKQHPNTVRGFVKASLQSLARCGRRSECRYRGTQEGRASVQPGRDQVSTPRSNLS